MGSDEVLAIPAGMSGGVLVTGQVHVQLLDLRGAVLAEGAVSGRGEAVSLGALNGGAGALRVQRSLGGLLGRDAAARFPGTVAFGVTPVVVR